MPPLLRAFPGDHGSALLLRLPADVYDIVGGFDHIQVVLDHDHGVAVRGQAVQDLGQLVHICEMKARGGLIQDINGPAGASFAKLRRQLDPLRLSPDRVVDGCPRRI